MQNKDEANTSLIVGEQNELLPITTTHFTFDEACDKKCNGKATRARETTTFPRKSRSFPSFPGHWRNRRGRLLVRLKIRGKYKAAQTASIEALIKLIFRTPHPRESTMRPISFLWEILTCIKVLPDPKTWFPRALL